MVPKCIDRKQLALLCSVMFALLGGCSYQPVKPPAGEGAQGVGRVVGQPDDTTSAASEPAADPDLASEQRAPELRDPAPRQRLVLPPTPEDEELDLKPAGAILIRLPESP